MAMITCGRQTAAAQLVVGSTSYIADFTGHISLMYDPNVLSRFTSGATNVVSLLIQEDVMSGVGPVIGLITWVMDPNRVPPESTMTSVTRGQPFPAITDIIFNINVTIPNLLPGITMQNKIPSNPGPSILRNANTTNFPPQNDIYQLVEPVELEDVNNPGPVLASINRFPTTVNAPTP